MRYMILVKATKESEAGVMPPESSSRRWRTITRSS
jgi:hypothetical protein